MSVIIPTRNRFQRLREMLATLISHALAPAHAAIVALMDSDSRAASRRLQHGLEALALEKVPAIVGCAASIPQGRMSLQSVVQQPTHRLPVSIRQAAPCGDLISRSVRARMLVR